MSSDPSYAANPSGRRAARLASQDAGTVASTPKDLTANHPNASVAGGDNDNDASDYQLGPVYLQPSTQTAWSGPDGIKDTSTQHPRTREVGDVMQTPSMSSPAATRPMRETNKSLSIDDSSLA